MYLVIPWQKNIKHKQFGIPNGDLDNHCELKQEALFPDKCRK